MTLTERYCDRYAGIVRRRLSGDTSFKDESAAWSANEHCLELIRRYGDAYASCYADRHIEVGGRCVITLDRELTHDHVVLARVVMLLNDLSLEFTYDGIWWTLARRTPQARAERDATHGELAWLVEHLAGADGWRACGSSPTQPTPPSW